MFGTMLICIGVLAFVSGLVASHRHRDVGLRLRAFDRVPSNRGHVSEDIARVDGFVQAGEGGTLVAPCSGESVVWFRVRLRKVVAQPAPGGGAIWATIAEEQDGRDFLIDAGTHMRAHIDAVHARVWAETKVYQRLSTEAMRRLSTFLTGRSGYLLEAFAKGSSRPVIPMQYEEECLRPGEHIIVVGTVQGIPNASDPHLYRDAPSSALVVAPPPGKDLLISSHRTLQRHRFGTYFLGRIAMTVGTIAVIIGIVLRHIFPESHE